MAAPSIGQLYAQRATRKHYVKGEGWRIIVEYQGTLDQLNALTLPGNPLDISIDGDGPIRTLSASYTADSSGNPDPEQYELLWEFDCNEIEIPLMNDATDGIAWVIKDQIRKVEEGETSYNSALSYITANGGGDNDQEIFRLIMKGTDSRPYSAAVIRLNLTFDKAATSPGINYANINSIYTTAGLYQEQPSLADEPVWLSEGYWLKKCPRTSRRSDGKYQLTQEWWFTENYSEFIYGPPIDAV